MIFKPQNPTQYAWVACVQTIFTIQKRKTMVKKAFFELNWLLKESRILIYSYFISHLFASIFAFGSSLISILFGKRLQRIFSIFNKHFDQFCFPGLPVTKDSSMRKQNNLTVHFEQKNCLIYTQPFP